MDIRGKKVAIIGFGRSGAALAELILGLGGEVKVSDSAARDVVESAVLKFGLQDKIQVESGGHTWDFLSDCDLMVVSPGVRRDALPICWAEEKKMLVLGEIELAWMFCENPVIAVTGSNGKTTVSTLIATILNKAGKKACLCGNIGSPFARHVQQLGPEDIVVLEISSFQLETTKTFRPDVAVLLNCTQNHLDRHKDMEEYFSAKVKLFSNQTTEDFAVLTFQDEKIRSLAAHLKAKVLYFDSPDEKRIYPDENPNFLAARKATQIFGVSDQIIAQVFQEFRGVEHRLEWVRTIDHVDFINDSKATTAEAGRWALLSAKKPVVMICGGSSKNLDYASLKPLVKEKVKKLIAIGEIKQQLVETFKDVVAVQTAETFEEAVRQAKQDAVKGDCVLLSPMTASFDMFKGFEDRGRVFKQIVHKL